MCITKFGNTNAIIVYSQNRMTKHTIIKKMNTNNYYDIVKTMSSEKLQEAINKLTEGLKTEVKWNQEHKTTVTQLIKKLKILLLNRKNAEILKDLIK